MAVVSTAVTATRVTLTLGQIIQKKYPGGIWGFLGSLFLLGVMLVIGLVAFLQALISAIPNWEESCGTGEGGGGGDNLNVPAGSLIFPMAKGTAVPTSPYGPRWGRLHAGQDWGAPLGTPMYAIADGKVLYAGASGTPTSGFGQSIWITHEINGKTWTSQYGHMPSATKYVKTGDTVKVGQQIAVVGNQGSSTGPHLHFQIHDGARKTGGTTDPVAWLKDRGAKEIAAGGGGNLSINNSSLINGVIGNVTKDLTPVVSNLTHNFWANKGLIHLSVLSKYSGLNSKQQENAKTIIAAGKASDVDSWGWTIALATAMQESTMNNINYGDRDSLGLFQQRPGTGWGTPAQITDPYKSSMAFYGTSDHTNNPGLKDIKGWDKMPLTVAAQKVQRSGHPDAYAKWEPLARDIVLQVADEVVAGPGQNGGNGIDCSEGGFGDVDMGECPAKASDAIENTMKVSGPGYKSARPDTLRVARCTYGAFKDKGITTILGPGQRPNKSDHTEGKAADVMIPKWNTPEGKKLGDAVAAFAVKYHKELGITYIIWDVKIINVSKGETTWRPYTHPNGNANPTVRHEDHVHISVKGNAGTGMQDPVEEQPGDARPGGDKAV